MKIKKLFAALLSTALVCSAGTASVHAEGDDGANAATTAASDSYEPTFHYTITDAGAIVDRMVIDYGDKEISGVDNDTYAVHGNLIFDAGSDAGTTGFYPEDGYDLPVVKTEVDGGKVTVYFDQSVFPVLMYSLTDARNLPGKITLTVAQNSAIKADGEDYTASYDASGVTSYADMENEELALFTAVDDEIDYEIHAGSNDKLIVWFHGNGEGDVNGTTGNNVAQVLANRGGVAWTTEEAQEYFGDATVIAFQAPAMWYYATRDGLLEKAYNEIQAVISKYGINEDEVYVSGCSAGGFMTTRMIIAYPDLFKAAMINCPALDVADSRSGIEGATPSDEELATLLDSDTAIWLVQADDDTTVKTADCAQRIWNIVADGKAVTETTVEQELDSDYTTWETADGKYKLTLYKTADYDGTAKLEFGEDYDQDGTDTLVSYANHWSWIYTLVNNPTDASGTTIWDWAANYDGADANEVTGTVTKIVIQPDDWQAYIGGAIVELSTEISADGVSADAFKAYETRTQPDWTNFVNGVPAESTPTSERKVVDAYLCDENGEKVDAESGKYVYVELYGDPNTGIFYYHLDSGYNTWSEYCRIDVKMASDAELTTAAGDAVTGLSASGEIDLTNEETRIVPLADDFNTYVYTADSGTAYNVASYEPEDDGEKHALVIWLHGAGEGGSAAVGNDVYVDLLGNEVTALVDEEFQGVFDGAYILVPQSPTFWMDNGEGQYQGGEKDGIYTADLKALIDAYVAEHEDIDTDRIIIGGCSNGGYMTVEMVRQYPEYFAAAFPICEAFTDTNLTDDEIQAIADGGTGLWFIYALSDTTVDPATHEIPTVNRLRQAGADIHTSVYAITEDKTGRFFAEDGTTPYEYSGHWSWIYFDNNDCVCDEDGKNCWEWLAEQSRANDKGVAVFRLYDANRGEHFYTISTEERDYLVEAGWTNEGTGWFAPETSDTAVFCLYNPYGAEHHFTTNAEEVAALVALGWQNEGIKFYSDGDVAVYCSYNPNQFANNHNLTTNKVEADTLAELGWNDEGIKFYALAHGSTIDAE